LSAENRSQQFVVLDEVIEAAARIMAGFFTGT
jgi:hypothetical protein